MAQSLYINFNAEDLRSARVRGASDLRSQKFTQLVAGDSIQYDIYLTGPDGLLDIQNYAEVRLGLGNLDARPESGDYLVAGTDTLAYDHTAPELKAVVDSTASLSTVTKLTGFVFKVQFDAVGAQTIPSLNFANLQPRSTVSVTRLIAGDATTKETWLWRLYRDPIAFTSEFTDVAGSGVRGVLNLATAGVYDLLEQFNQIQTFLEVELTDTEGNVQTVLQTKIRLNGEVIGHNFSGSIPTSPTNSPEANAFLESFPDPTIVGDLTVGGFNLPTGSADGYVLTADASGVGTWQANEKGGSEPTIAVSDAAAMQVIIDASSVQVGQLFSLASDSSIRRFEGGNASRVISDSIGVISYPYTTDFQSGVEQTRNLTSITNSSGYFMNSNLSSVYLGSNVTSIGSSAFYFCDNLTSVNIPDSVTSIGSSAFYFCEGLTSVTIGNSVTSIGSSAFYYCSGLTSLTIPNSVTDIGSGAFNTCYHLTSINIPDSVISLGSDAFYLCTSLTSVTIGNGVTSIGSRAFYRCDDITSLTIGNSVTDIGAGAFNTCDSLISIIIPDSVISIGSKAFQNCSSLTSLTIGNSVTSFGTKAFSSCTSLTSVIIPDSVTSIGGSAFQSCTDLTSIAIPYSVTSIGNDAFQNCSSLTSVTIGSGVTSIGFRLFGDCTSLTSINIPNGVTSIGSKAFQNCSSAATINCLATTAPTIGSDAFQAVAATDIHVPVGATGYGTTYGGLTVVADL